MAQLIRLKDLMPDYYESVVEMNKLLEVEQFQIDELTQEIDRQQKNQFVLTSDIQGIKAWEQLMGIEIDNSLALDTRRYNVLSHMLPPKPITIRYVQELLDLLNINAVLNVNHEDYKISIHMTTSDSNASQRLERLLNVLLPANLSFTTFNIRKTNNYGQTHVGTGALMSTKYTNSDKEEL